MTYKFLTIKTQFPFSFSLSHMYRKYEAGLLNVYLTTDPQHITTGIPHFIFLYCIQYISHLVSNYRYCHVPSHICCLSVVPCCNFVDTFTVSLEAHPLNSYLCFLYPIICCLRSSPALIKVSSNLIS